METIVANIDINPNNLLVASPEPAFLVPKNTDKRRCHVSLRVVRHVLVIQACPGFDMTDNVIAFISPISNLRVGARISCVHNGQTMIFGTVSKVLCFSGLESATSAPLTNQPASGVVVVTAGEGIDQIPSPLPDACHPLTV
jgi:hypothetical protein